MNDPKPNYQDIFSFIDNEILRNNIKDALNYAAELTIIAKSYSTQVRSIFYKTSIVYLASIVEAILHYYAVKAIKTYEDVSWTYKDVQILYRVHSKNLPKSEIVGAKRYKKECQLGYIDFKVLNKICLENGVYKNHLYQKIDNIRVLRNKIHLFGLESIDRRYQKRKVESVSRVVYKVRKIIETKLIDKG